MNITPRTSEALENEVVSALAKVHFCEDYRPCRIELRRRLNDQIDLAVWFSNSRKKVFFGGRKKVLAYSLSSSQAEALAGFTRGLLERRFQALGSRTARPMRPIHFLLQIAVWLLSPSERNRYLEEFSAELLDLPRTVRLRHALSVLRGVCVLRLRGEAENKAADAPARRAKD